MTQAFNMDCMEVFDVYIAFKDGRIYSQKSRKFLKPLQSSQYDCVVIGGKTRAVHRIIASCFVPNPDNKPCVNHVDGNKRNNNADNLEWCTFSENLRHAYANGLNKRERPVVRVSESGEEKVYRSARQAESDGFKNQLIARCCKGVVRKHGGYAWRYAE